MEISEGVLFFVANQFKSYARKRIEGKYALGRVRVTVSTWIPE